MPAIVTRPLLSNTTGSRIGCKDGVSSVSDVTNFIQVDRWSDAGTGGKAVKKPFANL